MRLSILEPSNGAPSITFVLALTACLALCGVRPSPPMPPTGPPSVLLIILDDVGRAEDVLLPSLFGSGGLASHGVSMDLAYACPVCSPTRYAMMTGRLPRRDGIGDLVMASMPAPGPDTKRIGISRQTMAKAFAPTFETGLFGKWHMGRSELEVGEGQGLGANVLATIQAPIAPFLAGFEWVEACNPDVPNSGPGATGYYKWYRGDHGKLTLDQTHYAVDAERDAFLAWWATSSADPRMCWLSWSAAHNSGTDVYETPPGMTDQATTREDYQQVVTYLDTQLATVLAAVDLSSTFVVVVGDNGTPDDARPAGTPTGYWKFTTFEGGTRVPCIVAGPGISQGVVSQRVVSLVDIPATLAELAGVELLSGFEDSQSFANALGASWSGTPERSFAFTERYSATYDDQAVVERETIFGTVHLRMKLRRVDSDGTGAGASADLYYDLLSDPFEMNPQAAGAVAPTIRNRLLGELASVPARQ